MDVLVAMNGFRFGRDVAAQAPPGRDSGEELAPRRTEDLRGAGRGLPRGGDSLRRVRRAEEAPPHWLALAQAP
jgi:hypothetical protein